MTITMKMLTSYVPRLIVQRLANEATPETLALVESFPATLLFTEKFNMLFEKGLIHYHLGRHATIGTEHRQINLYQAAEIFSQLTIDYDLGKVKKSQAASM
ncbi:MAG: hypothetical protein AAF485_06620 [Chloroflexota bacterium]